MERRSREKMSSAERKAEADREEASRVRFRSEAGLVQVHELPVRERVDAQIARRGAWRKAPDDDPIWDGELQSFREEELSVDELAEVVKMRRRSKRRGLLSLQSLFGRTNYKQRVQEELDEQGSYRDPLDVLDGVPERDLRTDDCITEDDTNKSEADYGRSLEAAGETEETEPAPATGHDGEPREEAPKRKSVVRTYSSNHHHKKPLRPALKTNSRILGGADSDAQKGEGSSRLSRAYKDSLRTFADRRALSRKSRRGRQAANSGKGFHVDRDHIIAASIAAICLALLFASHRVVRLVVRKSNPYMDLLLVSAVAAVFVGAAHTVLSLLPVSLRTWLVNRI